MINLMGIQCVIIPSEGFKIINDSNVLKEVF